MASAARVLDRLRVSATRTTNRAERRRDRTPAKQYGKSPIVNALSAGDDAQCAKFQFRLCLSTEQIGHDNLAASRQRPSWSEVPVLA